MVSCIISDHNGIKLKLTTEEILEFKHMLEDKQHVPGWMTDHWMHRKQN